MRKTAARMASENPSFISELGQLVKDRRLELIMSQKDVEVRTNGLVSQSTLSRIEKGEYLTTSEDRLQALADALTVPVGDLINAQSRMVSLAEDELAKGFGVSSNPLQELGQVAAALHKDNLATLVRLARVMAFGQRISDRRGPSAGNNGSDGHSEE